MLNIFKKQNSPGDFWEWFQKNKNNYKELNLITDERRKEEVFEALGVRLGKYCKYLAWEIGNDIEGNQELIISAEGKKEFFYKVETLVNNAPLIDGWKIIAFKQSIPGKFKSKWQDSTIETDDLVFEATYLKEKNELGVLVYLRQYNHLKHLEYLKAQVDKMLDTIVGEKSYALDIQYFDLEPLPVGKKISDYNNILELPDCIAWFKSERLKSSS